MRKQSSKRLAVWAFAGLAAFGTAGAWADTVINGTVYADFTDKDNKDKFTGNKSTDSGFGTDVKRFYFTATNQFDSVWSAQFQTDIGDQGAKRYDVFVKKAYIQAKIAPEFSLRLGSANLPWVPFVEDLYGYRYVENVLVDRLSFGTSADWGVHALGQFGGGMVEYAGGAINGRGYSNPTRSKSVDFEGRLDVQPITGLYLAIGGYDGKRGLDVKTNSPALHTASRYNGLVAWTSSMLRLGGEYFQAKNWNNVTTVPTDKANGYSLWGSITPGGGTVSIFGRYDDAKPSKDLKPNLKDQFFNAGVQWRFNTSFAASLVYKYDKVKGGTITTSDGTIGSVNAGSSGQFNEFGVFALYTF